MILQHLLILLFAQKKKTEDGLAWIKKQDESGYCYYAVSDKISFFFPQKTRAKKHP